MWIKVAIVLVGLFLVAQPFIPKLMAMVKTGRQPKVTGRSRADAFVAAEILVEYYRSTGNEDAIEAAQEAGRWLFMPNETMGK
jgi:hypothetical protein